MRLIVSALLAAALLCAQQKKSVFIITDAEGVGGVCRQDQTDPKDVEMRALLTGEINAAVQGFLDGGADEVIVWDGHDGSQTLSSLTIHPKAKLLMGSPGLTMTFDRHYTALAFIGQHAMGDVRAGVMAHSYNSLGIQKMLLNGKQVGEIETNVAMAGWFGTPVIMLSGDRAAVQELRAIVPEAVFAEVKEGLGRYTCISLSAQSARELIHDRAKESMTRIGSIRPYKIEGPVTIQIEHTTRNSLPIDAGLAPGATVLDDLTIKFEGKDFLEAWRRARRQ